jgi:hypothetical protein
MTSPKRNYTPRSPRTARRFKRIPENNQHLMMTGALLRLAKQNGNTSVTKGTKRILKELNSGMVRKLFKLR